MNQFKEKLNILYPNHKEPINITFFFKHSTNQGVFFVTKWYEMLERYSAERYILNMYNSGDYGKRHTEIKDQEHKKIAESFYNINIYETALIYYNIVVDLSWSLIYAGTEYIHHSNKKEKSFEFIIEDAYKYLREIESSISSPKKEKRYDYLKSNYPNFAAPIDTVTCFWKDFRTSDIRKKYNYIKHLGQPAYTEMEALRKPAFLSFFKDSISISDIQNVRKELSLEEEVKKLLEFDNNTLYPYIKELIESLYEIIRPSTYLT
jgi:hypothetical protein